VTKKIPQHVKTAVETAKFFANMPGVNLEAQLHPQQIPAHTRNKVKRMLRSGFITGGWQSKARRLTEALNRQFQLALTDSNRLEFPSVDATQARQDIVELLTAQKVTWALLGLTDRYKRAIEHTDERINELLNGTQGPLSMYYIDSQFAEQIAAIIISAKGDLNFEKVEALCTQLDDTKPFTLTFW
jgi:hypothetical protein